MHTINEIINNVDTIENNILESHDCNYCKNVYHTFTELKKNIDIECPYEIYKKIERIIDLAHRKYNELKNYENNTIYHNLDEIFNNIIYATKKCQVRERQINIIYAI